jgi:hypothetical protein
MLGVRRAGITEALALLESRGVIAKTRGALKIVDRDALQANTCECYKIIDDRFSWQRAMTHYEHHLDPAE